MEQLKSFRKQVLECERSKNRVEIKCVHCGRINLICKKHNDICHSKACFEERLTK